MVSTCGQFVVPFIRVLRLTLAMVNILHLSIEEKWSELHSFENMIQQTAGRGSFAKIQREDVRLVVEDDVKEGTVHVHSAAADHTQPRMCSRVQPNHEAQRHHRPRTSSQN